VKGGIVIDEKMRVARMLLEVRRVSGGGVKAIDV
jgi:hypothetical protein